MRQVFDSYSFLLFKYASQHNEINKYYESSKQILKVLERNEKIIEYFAYDGIDIEERKKQIMETFKGMVPEYFIYIMWVMIDFDKFSKIILVLKHFNKICQNELGIEQVKLYSATELDKKDEVFLSKKISEYFKNKKIIIEKIIDPSLIGGIKFESNHKSLDLTIKYKLTSLAEKLILDVRNKITEKENE